MSAPQKLNNPLYTLTHSDDSQAFNTQHPTDQLIDLSNGDFRGLDLHPLNASTINFSSAYFRDTDLRGLDLRSCILVDTSLAHAQLSGAYLLAPLVADEILMSVKYGTRFRCYSN